MYKDPEAVPSYSKPRVRSFRRRPKHRRVRRRFKTPPGSRIVVPSFFTLMNLLSGFLAIIQIHEGRLEYACWLIVLAGFFDLLDGMMARLARATSPFGVELDSLSDIVSFGVAPGFLLYEFGLKELNTLGTILAALPAITGAVRLARYNVFQEDHAQKGNFSGLPIPVMALTVVAFILTFDDVSWFDRLSMGRLSVLIPLVIALSALMISNISYEALPRPSKAFVRAHPWKALLLFIATMLVLVFHETGLFLVLSLYIISGPVRMVVELFFDPMHVQEEDYLRG